MKICMLAGKIILQNGGETSRVEDTMMRIAAAYGYSDSHSYVTPTGILFAIDGTAPSTRLIRISERSTNLRKVSLVNDISRRIVSGRLGAEEAYTLLHEVEAQPFAYGEWLQTAAAAVASGCFVIMFQGSWHDVLPGVLAGGLGFLLFVLLHRLVPVKFFAEFMAAISVGVVSVLMVQFGLGDQLDKIIIGSVMPLVPGLHITNAVRDLMAGHLVSGLSKGAEAFLTAFAIGSGIAVVLSFA
ncbi:threonine/serine exporter family protein [Paenibacillus sp. NEAU-GSW1]|uniref:threonine/serine exporter family protein n=1 Tax=Paenibacillus sp. NEAU-GSW1 TaxID=2682486 RepID=UPI001566ABD7|nr:threonine/serine exporter family protein [Paenibacillus sp. NEAU-GSW1]